MNNIDQQLDEHIFDSVWAKKYAPKDVDDMVLSEENRAIVNQYIQAKEFPSLLLCGKPGQGKTTLATLLCKKIRATVLFYNASMDTGIAVIRDRVKNFVDTMSETGSLKVVILDEADRLSVEAQDALKGLIEENAAHTRFILTANESSRITAPLQSRLISLNMTPPMGEFKKYVINILKSESVIVTKDDMAAIKEVFELYYPDIRKTINKFQKSVINGHLNIQVLSENKSFIENLYKNIVGGDPIEIREIWIKNEKDFHGDYQFLLKQLHEYVYEQNDIDPNIKANIVLLIAEGLKDSITVLDQEINFYSVVLNIMKRLGLFS